MAKYGIWIHISVFPYIKWKKWTPTTEVDKTLSSWSGGLVDHAKKNCPLKQWQAHNVNNSKWKPIDKHIPKQLKCFPCRRNNHIVKNSIALHLKKFHFLNRGGCWKQRLALWKRDLRMDKCSLELLVGEVPPPHEPYKKLA